MSGFARTLEVIYQVRFGDKKGDRAVVGFMSVEVQAEADFSRARRRAFFGQVAARLRRECGRLLAFDEVGERHSAHNRRRLGLRDVEVSKIVGSVGRHEAFDRDPRMIQLA